MKLEDIKGKEWEPDAISVSGFRLAGLRKHYPAACRKLGYTQVPDMTLDELLELDRVVLAEPIDDVTVRMAEKCRDMGIPLTVSAMPFLKEGVLIFPDNFSGGSVTTYSAWMVTGKNRIYLETYALGDTYTLGRPTLSHRMNIDATPTGMHLEYESREKVILDAWERGKIKLTPAEQRLAKESVEQLHKQTEYLSKCAVALFQVINSLLEAQEREKPEAGRKYTQVLRANKKKGLGTRIVYLDDITVEPGKASGIKIRRGTIMNRHTDVWGVRGHERHYKSGKVIWIDAYEKGPERGKKKREPKTYSIGRPE